MSVQLAYRDEDSHAVCVFNEQGEFVRHIGMLNSAGISPGFLYHPKDVALDSEYNVSFPVAIRIKYVSSTALETLFET